jgi:hypothetical protein
MSEKFQVDVLERTHRHAFWSFIIAVTAHAEKHKGLFDAAFAGRTGHEVTFIVDGVELPFSAVMDEMEAQYEQQVEQAAVDLLQEKARRLAAMFPEIEELVRDRIREVFPGARLDGD